jgi:hypothetical protein
MRVFSKGGPLYRSFGGTFFPNDFYMSHQLLSCTSMINFVCCQMNSSKILKNSTSAGGFTPLNASTIPPPLPSLRKSNQIPSKFLQIVAETLKRPLLIGDGSRESGLTGFIHRRLYSSRLNDNNRQMNILDCSEMREHQLCSMTSIPKQFEHFKKK